MNEALASFEVQETGASSKLTLALELGMLEECAAMMEHARSAGAALSPDVLQFVMATSNAHAKKEPVDAERLIRAHNALSELVRPATPGSIVYLKTQRQRRHLFKFLGPIPTIRDMVLVTIISLVCFLGVASSGDINSEAMSKSFLDRVGYGELAVSAFMLASAAIGASFANLYKAYQFVIEGSYDPKYDATYWIRFVLGLIAGYILAEILTLDISDSFEKPLLALLGGFSASAVFRILNKMVDAVESLVKGDVRVLVAAREAEIRSRLERQDVVQRVELAKELMETRGRLKDAGDIAAFGPEFDKMIKKVIGSQSAGI